MPKLTGGFHYPQAFRILRVSVYHDINSYT
jgi:hypothetical protein